MLREYLGCYHPARTQLSLGKDAPVPRPGQPPSMGRVASIAVLGGLVLSTALSLLVVPAFYLLASRLRAKVGLKPSHAPAETAG